MNFGGLWEAPGPGTNENVVRISWRITGGARFWCKWPSHDFKIAFLFWAVFQVAETVHGPGMYKKPFKNVEFELSSACTHHDPI